MTSSNNISPFCLLNGKLNEQLFDFTQAELSDFHKAIKPDMLSEVFDAVEDEYNIQNSPTALNAATAVADYLSALTPTELDKFSEYLIKGVAKDNTKNKVSDFLTPNTNYSSPKVEMLEGYIAISSSNLKALDKFKDRVIKSSDIPWEHRIKKHGDVTIHSYVFNINENSK
tara:strand:- start:125 stop:637 length:513 start_codon:yes stop_codon:yes gene_type:complete